MLIIGLTGGIGSGKTTAAKMFADLGADIIDTDQLAREVVAPGTPALKKISEHFGEEILDKKQQLDRAKLRTIVFQKPTERKWLEQLLHPLIREKTRECIATSHTSYCIVVIPLLVETKPNSLINRVLVVDTPEEQQIQRAKERDHLSDQEITAILKSQVSRAERLAAADDIIYNDRDLDHLKQQVLKLHNYYLKLTEK